MTWASIFISNNSLQVCSTLRLDRALLRPLSYLICRRTSEVARVIFNCTQFTHKKTVSHQELLVCLTSHNYFTYQFSPYLIPKRDCSCFQKGVQESKVGESKEKGIGLKREESDARERPEGFQGQGPIRLSPGAFEPVDGDRQEFGLH